MSNNINICISCDDNYAQYAGVVMASVLLSAGEDDEFSFYILDGGISDKKKLRINRLRALRNCDINFVRIDKSQFDVYKNLLVNENLSEASYYRLKLTELLPRVERVIYLDCDIIVRKSLYNLFNINLDDEYVAGVLDSRVKYDPEWKDSKYINCGVLLIDLNKIRWDNVSEQFLDYVKNNPDKIVSGDQDVINYTLEGKIKIVSDSWNVQVANFYTRNTFTKDPDVIHYVSDQKPWIYASYNHFKSEYFKVLAHTSWKVRSTEKYKWSIWNHIFGFLYFLRDDRYFFTKLRFWEAVFKTMFNID